MESHQSDYMDGYQEIMMMDSQQAPGGVIIYDSGSDRIIHANQYVVDLCECESVVDFLELVQGRFHNFVFSEDAVAVWDSKKSQLAARSGYDHIYYRVMTKSGKLVSVEEYGHMQNAPDGQQVFCAFITKAAQRDFVDWLTGLPSVVRFQFLAKSGFEAMVSRGQQPAALAFDIIDMKSYNERYGREQGDVLLKEFADVLRKYFGSEACSRFGEDHFYAYAPVEGIREKIDGLIEDFSHAIGGKTLPVRVGVYPCDPDDDIVATGFDYAKAACDLDRTTWGSHVTWFEDRLKHEVKLRAHILRSIDQAMAEGWVRPYYQAILRSSTGKICGEEALARWADPQYGPLSPAQFIPVLEEAGLLHKLDMHIIDCVLRDFATKAAHGLPLVPVSVNMSLRDLEKVDISSEVVARADAVGVSHDLIRIEFTESAASENPELFKEQVEALRKAGFRVWMDDFGSGYSSLNTLQDFDFDLIKLDMGFISKFEDKKARDIIGGIVQIARNMGVSTLAEGVETEPQALYLESIGCDMLQGFFFIAPQPLENVIGRFERFHSPREELVEGLYWSTIGSFDLSNPAANMEGRSVDGSPIAEFPAGILERREETWRFVRTNEALRDFLDRVGILSRSRSSLSSNPVDGPLGEELEAAIERSRVSRAWERVGGRVEYGTGFQFYVRPHVEAPRAEAFALASVPTMLGTALGSYGDVPVAYAVFRARLDETGKRLIDAEFVYANEMYHELMGFEPESLTGRSYLDAVGGEYGIWASLCYGAAVRGETVHDVFYSKRMGHWLSFSMAPSPVQGCCVCAFMIADDERMEREEIEVGRDTSNLVIKIANVLNIEEDYDVAMNTALQMMSEVIHPERLYVFERSETMTNNTFEWCAEGVEPMIESLQGLDNSEFDTWEKLMAEEPVVLIPDVTAFKDDDPQMYWQLSRQGITHLLAVPFMHDGELIGYLGADNYALDERLDTRRILEDVSHFMSGRIASHRMVLELERTGTHDNLTGLLNRRGLDQVIAKRLAEHEGEPYALALMDIDNFKTINDLHGHDVGDEVLRETAKTILEVFPESAVVGRNGGDEFLIMLLGDDASHAEELFSEFLKVGVKCEFETVCCKVSFSIGYSTYPEQTGSLRRAYSLADAALYSVKIAGKSGFEKYSPEHVGQYRSQLGFTPRDIAGNVPGAIVVHRAGGDGEILFANDEVIGMFECSSFSDFIDLTGGAFKGVVHPDDRDRVYEELTELELDDGIGEKNYSSYRVLTKTGKVKHVVDTGRLVEIEGLGKVFYVLMVDQDEHAENAENAEHA